MSTCYCDYEIPAFFSATLHKARTRHKCDECGRTILPGSTYEAARGKWDDEFQSYKMCAWCMKLRDWVQAHVPCFCWAYTNLHEDATETISRYASESPGLMFSTYRLIVKARRQPKWETNL